MFFKKLKKQVPDIPEDTPAITKEQVHPEQSTCDFIIRAYGGRASALISAMPLHPLTGENASGVYHPRYNRTYYNDKMMQLFNRFGIDEQPGYCIGSLKKSFVGSEKDRSCNNNFSIEKACDTYNCIAEIFGFNAASGIIEHLIVDDTGTIIFYNHHENKKPWNEYREELPWIISDKMEECLRIIHNLQEIAKNPSDVYIDRDFLWTKDDTICGRYSIAELNDPDYDGIHVVSSMPTMYRAKIDSFGQYIATPNTTWVEENDKNNIQRFWGAGTYLFTLYDTFLEEPARRSCNNNYSICDECKKEGSTIELNGHNRELHFEEHIIINKFGKLILYEKHSHKEGEDTEHYTPLILTKEYTRFSKDSTRPILVCQKTNKEYIVTSDIFTIGFNEKNDLRIEQPKEDHYVSNFHATLIVMPNGKITISDYSRNGTFISGKGSEDDCFVRIPPNMAIKIENGMYVKFANEVFQFFENS